MQFLFRSHILRCKKLSACINYNGSSRQDFLFCCLHRFLYFFLQTIFFEYSVYLKFHKINLSVQFLQTVQLVCSLLHMGTDQNDSSIPCISFQLLSSKKGLIRNPSHYLGKSCCCSCHVMFSLFHGKHQCCTENLQISVRYCIHNNLRHVFCSHKLHLDPLHIQSIQFVQRNGDTVLFMVFSFCFFLYVFCKVGGFVAEGLVLCKLCHSGRNQIVLFFYVMDIIHCIAPAFWEKRTDDLTINTSALVLCQAICQKLCFQRIVTSQCGISTGNDHEVLSQLSGNLRHSCGNILMNFCSFLHRKAS